MDLDFLLLTICHLSSVQPPNGWAEWGDFGQLAGALLNAGFLLALIWQVQQGRKANLTAEKSARAAREAVREAARTRADENAPRVIALLEKPKRSQDKGTEFVFPRDMSKDLSVTVKGLLVNEGRGTARVRLHAVSPAGDAIFVWGRSEFMGKKRVELPAKVHQLDDRECILQPGDMALFLVIGKCTLEEWAEAHGDSTGSRGSCRLTIGVTDSFEHGVMDTIFIEIQGRPLEPVPEASGHWRLTEESNIAAVAYPTHRTYRAEGWKTPRLPWADRDEQWAKQNRQD